MNKWECGEYSSVILDLDLLKMYKLLNSPIRNWKKVFKLNWPLGRFNLLVAMSVCLSVPLRKTHLLVDWRLLVKGRIANIGLPSQFILLFRWFGFLVFVNDDFIWFQPCNHTFPGTQMPGYMESMYPQLALCGRKKCVC